MIALPHAARIYLALGATDMRKSYDTLAQVTREKIGEEPLSGHLFVFCNGGRNRLKILRRLRADGCGDAGRVARAGLCARCAV